jgi:hypothetical protein
MLLNNMNSFDVWLISNGIGMSKTISMSKTMKIIASKKNRMENGIRADRSGSNPHSNGDSFSRRFDIVRVARIHARMNRIGGRIEAISIGVNINIIY